MFIWVFVIQGILTLQHTYKSPQFEHTVECDPFLFCKMHLAVYGGIQRIIIAASDICTGMVFGSALPDNDASWARKRTFSKFDAEPLTLGVASQLCRAAGFLMSHISRD